MKAGVVRQSVVSLVLALSASAVLGGDIPNWPAPATWSPARSRGVGAMDVTNPLPFIGLTPCRIVDTRGNGAPIQGGIFTGGSDVRSYALAGICGIPASARAVSLNFTVTGPGQTAPGFLTAWPTGGAVPIPSVLNWDHVPAQVANAAVVPTSAATSITVNVSAPTHVIVDVNGYYYDGVSGAALGTGEQLKVIGNIAGSTATFQNQSASPSSSGVLGFASATTGTTYGVYPLVGRDILVGILAGAVSGLVLTLVYLGSSENLRADVPAALLFGALMVFVAARFGILALYATFLVFGLIYNFPLTLDFSHWYAGRSLFVLLIIVGLAFSGFWIALGGRSPFGTLASEE